MPPRTAARTPGRLRLASESRHTPLVASSVLGMLIFVATEVMFFAGLISAFTIIRAETPVWPPPDQPRLPIERTALNTAALLLSGVVLAMAHRAYLRDRRTARAPLLVAMLLGGFFVLFQGAEWISLLRQGLTLTSSSLGSFFYLIVGLHALHAVIAIGLLAYAWLRLQRGWLVQSQLVTAEVFWYFVVGLWPVLYGVVYL
ncbi:MAG TPA: heme-copper oxidase subunit III [Myxococcota bacterium]|nr:heme-copper oxidase subunit III [Myxococcota bacterium]